MHGARKRRPTISGANVLNRNDRRRWSAVQYRGGMHIGVASKMLDPWQGLPLQIVYDAQTMSHMPWLAASRSSNALKPANDIPLGRLIREDVLSSILRGELRPGQRITEPAIAARLGVSRVPVREALRELESAGLVESRKHTGVFVRQLSDAETADLYELRSVLDAFGGKRAAEAPTPDLIKILKLLLSEMDAAAAISDISAYYNANLRFHWAIVEASGNAQVIEAYRGIVQKLHLARLTNLASNAGIQFSVREHRAIFNAIRAGKPADCETLMAHHVKAAKRRLFNISVHGDPHAA